MVDGGFIGCLQAIVDKWLISGSEWWLILLENNGKWSRLVVDNAGWSPVWLMMLVNVGGKQSSTTFINSNCDYF